MKKSTQIWLMIAALFLLGLGAFTYKALWLGIPIQQSQANQNWVVEAKINFLPKLNKPVKFAFAIPNRPLFFSVLGEHFLSPSYGVSFEIDGPNREIIWSKRRASGSQTLYYRIIVTQNKHQPLSFPSQYRKITPAFNESEKAAIQELLSKAKDQSADTLTLVSAIIQRLHNTANPSSKLLLNSSPTAQKITFLAAYLLQSENIEALPVQAIRLVNQKDTRLRHYLLVKHEDAVNLIDSKTGQLVTDKNLLIWTYQASAIFSPKNIRNVRVFFSITEKFSSVHPLKSRLMDLSELPIQTQYLLQILLTIPVGAFVILICRNFIGFKTIGTFLPALLALAFLESGVLWGIVLISSLLTIGLSFRFYLNHLRLLLIPRLSAILTMVIIGIMLISILSHQLGIEPGLSVVLFPIIIMTILIENISNAWDENGAKTALKLTLNTVLVAILAFFVMRIHELQYLLFTFPELTLAILGLILLFGQYRGYRLSELKRFKQLTVIKP